MICCLVPFWLVQRYCMSFQTDRVPPRKVEPHFTLGVFFSRSSNLPWFHMFPHLQTSFQRDAKCSVMMFFSGWHCHLASLGLEPTKKKPQNQLMNDLWMTHRKGPYSDIPRMERSRVFMVMPSLWHFQHGRAAWNYDDVSKNSFHRSQAQLETTKDVETHCSTMKKT